MGNYAIYCNGLIECPTTLLSFIIMQHAHFWSRHTSTCSCLQIGHIHEFCCSWRWTRLSLLLLLWGSLIVFPFCCSCCFDLSPTYSHNKIKGIPNAKNTPIVRIGIRKTNNDIPKHTVAKPRVKIQRFVRLSTIYRILTPLFDIWPLLDIWDFLFIFMSCLLIFYVRPVLLSAVGSSSSLFLLLRNFLTSSSISS